MSAFQPPTINRDKNRQWREATKLGFHSTKRLWGDYWQRFNTITIPLLDEDAYFADAIAAARVAENREHLEELLADKLAERRQHLENVLGRIGLDSFYGWRASPHSSERVRDAALRVSRMKSLDSFLEFVCGSFYGWGGGGGGEDDKSRPFPGPLPEPNTTTDGEDGGGAADEDVGEGGAAQGDEGALDDTSGAEPDPYEAENRHAFDRSPSPAWVDENDDAWNANHRVLRVHEYDEADEAVVGRGPRLPSAESVGRISEMDRAGAGQGGTETAASASSPRIPPPAEPYLSRPPGAQPTGGAPRGPGPSSPSPSSRDFSRAGGAESSPSPRTAATPDVLRVTSSPVEGEEAGGYPDDTHAKDVGLGACHGRSATGKRSFGEGRGREEGAEQGRVRKRRATDGCLVPSDVRPP